MITAEELARISLFDGVDAALLDQLAKSVPDIRVAPGEYIVHEGEVRALYITIEGLLEVTKLVGGVEQVIGQRLPGALFGEAPLTLNTPFPASMRGVEPSRVIRVGVKEFHTLAAQAPEVSARLGAAALTRIQGLRDIAAAPPNPDLTVIGPRWDGQVHELRTFLHGNQVAFDWRTADDGQADEGGPYPIVRLPDGAQMIAPTTREVAKAIGLAIAPEHTDYDVVIVGGGPAGMAAAVYGTSEGLRTLLIEKMSPGGQAGTSSRIENYLGFPFGLSGDELATRALNQARRLGAEVVVTRTVEGIDMASRTVTLDGGETITAKSIVLSMGVAWRRMEVDGLDRLVGKGVYYGAARGEAQSTQGKDIFLIGAGNSSGQAAIFFSNYARSVTLLCRGGDLAKSMSHYLIEQLKTKPNIKIGLCSQIAAVHGDKNLEAVDVLDNATGQTERREAAALFIMIGADAVTDWLPAEIARDENGFVLAGLDAVKTGGWPGRRDPFLLETTAPGVFAVGDVRAGSVKRIASGVGEGSMAIAFVHKYLAEG